MTDDRLVGITGLQLHSFFWTGIIINIRWAGLRKSGLWNQEKPCTRPYKMYW